MKRILSVFICMAIVVGTITGYGVIKAEEPEVTEETEVEETTEAIETEEVSKVEETTEVFDFSDHENIKLYYNFFNTKYSDITPICYVVDIDPYDSNDYICVDVMRKLESRGYDISDYTIVNRMGVTESGEEFVMSPIIKDTDIDSTKEFLWDTFDRDVNTGIDFKSVNKNKDFSMFLNHVGKEIYPKMIADLSYDQIQFEIVNHEYISDFEDMCGCTVNDFLNVIIYGIFVDKTIDVTIFDLASVINTYIPIN